MSMTSSSSSSSSMITRSAACSSSSTPDSASSHALVSTHEPRRRRVTVFDSSLDSETSNKVQEMRAFLNMLPLAFEVEASGQHGLECYRSVRLRLETLLQRLETFALAQCFLMRRCLCSLRRATFVSRSGRTKILCSSTYGCTRALNTKRLVRPKRFDIYPK